MPLRPTHADLNRAPTSADVARLAKVSQSTVSQVMNGKAERVRISAETREKVLEAANALGYIPNHAARSLRERRTKLIAFVLPTLENPYFSEVVSAAQAAAGELGYAVTILPLSHLRDEFRRSALLQGAACDGIVVAGHGNCTSPDLSLLMDRGLGVVILQEASLDPRVQSVSVDLEAGGHLATSHLIDLGHRRIAHVTERLRPSIAGQSRLDGYRRALAEAGIAFDPALVLVTENSMAGGAAAAHRLLELPGGASAAFAYNDQLAVGMLHALRERGVAVPGEFALVGFDGLAIGAFTAPTLTTVDSSRGALGSLAMRTLIAELEGGRGEAREHRLPVTLAIRDSCGARRAAAGGSA